MFNNKNEFLVKIAKHHYVTLIIVFCVVFFKSSSLADFRDARTAYAIHWAVKYDDKDKILL